MTESGVKSGKKQTNKQTKKKKIYKTIPDLTWQVSEMVVKSIQMFNALD